PGSAGLAFIDGLRTAAPHLSRRGWGLRGLFEGVGVPVRPRSTRYARRLRAATLPRRASPRDLPRRSDPALVRGALVAPASARAAGRARLRRGGVRARGSGRRGALRLYRSDRVGE